MNKKKAIKILEVQIEYIQEKKNFNSNWRYYMLSITKEIFGQKSIQYQYFLNLNFSIKEKKYSEFWNTESLVKSTENLENMRIETIDFIAKNCIDFIKQIGVPIRKYSIDWFFQKIYLTSKAYKNIKE